MPIKAWLHCAGSNCKGGGNDFVAFLERNGVDICNFDPYLSKSYGILLFDEFNPEICELLRKTNLTCPARVLAACFEEVLADQSIRLVQAGAADVFNCPNTRQAADQIAARLSRWEAIDRVLASPRVQKTLIGASSTWLSALRQVVESAHFSDTSILIQGATGTGKELIASLVHELDTRADKKGFVILDCSTIMPELSGSEFFGHERGAFTGAVASRDGAFALADGGTLFLDEIGELPLHLQTQLLRVIQQQTFKRVGGNAWQRTAFRLVCATNRDLWAQVQRGEFRTDLYFRIAGSICSLPSLAERPEDILPLAMHFSQEHSRQNPTPEFDCLVREYLQKRQYPGNIRDLRQVVGRMLCRHAGNGPLTVGCIPPEERAAWLEAHDDSRDSDFELAIRKALSQGIGLKGISRIAEETAIRIAVSETQGNLQQAAVRLGVTDRTLQMRRAAWRQDG